MILKKLFTFFIAATATILSAEDFSTSFADGKWDRSQWLNVKSPRWNFIGEMIQHSDHITNKAPNVPDQELLRKYEPQIYASLMLNKKFSGDATISSRMSFDHLMAPLIVIASEIGKSADGKYFEHRDHYEIVLFHKGINIWHHLYKNGKPSWYRSAYLKIPFQPKTVYDLQIQLRWRQGRCQMTVSCNGTEFGYMELNMPQTYYVGITGCEGRNRFYDFKVSQPKKSKRKK